MNTPVETIIEVITRLTTLLTEAGPENLADIDLTVSTRKQLLSGVTLPDKFQINYEEYKEEKRRQLEPITRPQIEFFGYPYDDHQTLLDTYNALSNHYGFIYNRERLFRDIDFRRSSVVYIVVTIVHVLIVTP